MTDVLDQLDNPVETSGETPPETPAATPPPDGWVRDRATGEYRPPKRRGRKPPATPPPTDHDPIDRGEDTEPDSKARGKNARGVPRWKAGVIAKGMTKLYRRTGKIVKAMDRDIGIAIIECAEDCGEAWDDIARQNPRIRAFLLKMITGGSWMALVWAHAPIVMAVVMKDGIRKHIPFMRFINTLFEPDEDGTSELSDALGGLNAADAQQMMQAAQAMMPNIIRSMGTWNDVPVADNQE